MLNPLLRASGALQLPISEAFRYTAAVKASSPRALAAALLLITACKAPTPENQGRWFGKVSPPAQNVFRFNNGAEPESIDPALATGQPDGRIARSLLEGLTTPHPETLEPLPGQAKSWEVSEDGRTYTFKLRKGLTWSDGTPLNAHDFVWSWLRALRPSTGSRYASVLHVIEGALAFNSGETTEDTVGVFAPDDHTFVVRLEQPTPYFLYLVQFYTYLPTPRHVIEAHGDKWTHPKNIVGNGPFVLESWRQQDRFVLVKNPRFRAADKVRLDKVIAYSVEDLNTSTNLYKAGVLDWNPSGSIPSQFVPYVAEFEDFRSGPYQGTYFYTLNVSRPPLDDLRVRQALNFAIDRRAIAEDLLKGSREAWGLLTPTGYPGYIPPKQVEYQPERARELLAEAGFPGGKGLRRLSILINTSEDHRRIAEAIQAMWKKELGILVEITNQEWGSYLQSVAALDYDIARRSWIGDYLDPNTFLSCFLTGDGNNRTGWGSADYDRLLSEATMEQDPELRFALLSKAEGILLDEVPVVPLLQYSTTELIKPYVRGIYQNAIDTHPLGGVYIERDPSRWVAAQGDSAERAGDPANEHRSASAIESLEDPPREFSDSGSEDLLEDPPDDLFGAPADDLSVDLSDSVPGDRQGAPSEVLRKDPANAHPANPSKTHAAEPADALPENSMENEQSRGAAQ